MPYHELRWKKYAKRDKEYVYGSGIFYASMGPEIYEFSLNGKILTIKTSPVDKIMVMTEGRNCFRKAANAGESISEAEFELTGGEGYIRLDIKDEKGLHANTNA